MFGRILAMGLFLGLAVSGARAATDVPGPPPFDAWLADLRADAAAAGVSEGTLAAALAGLEPDERVIELDRRQPEFTQTLAEYVAARVSETRIARGREMMARHRDTLRTVAAAYGVQPRFIAAIWGLETNYGGYTGGMSVIRSLATLAWDRRRASYFRKELISALKIVDAGHVDGAHMLGSWAGAMGQSQFMPSSFLDYAQDFDQDGRRDIWTSEADVFASIANYLKRHGWRDDVTWGRQVRLPHGLTPASPDVAAAAPPRRCARALKDHSAQLTLARWQALGVRRLDGRDLPARDLEASLVQPDGPGGAAYLTYGNFRAILSYNCSNHYAIAAGLLADALMDAE
ncbi:MAG: lytic transglycosylase domain-containing protein [Rhodothalassiaceae bacterium]